jgi:hypothetical protein
MTNRRTAAEREAAADRIFEARCAALDAQRAAQPKRPARSRRCPCGAALVQAAGLDCWHDCTACGAKHNHAAVRS